jgi:hypothetical protein
MALQRSGHLGAGLRTSPEAVVLFLPEARLKMPTAGLCITLAHL